ncbi:hypothetical protein EVAR_88333_1 [Eumeta japonica]|uniref:Uncharacterized protein n=1 Tax=Eumeta variegata TaxID=151549 RepID=A0A4C1YD36_EUMVA|nr:hypothetical protein EVAR_88333_1 [Eumeta japonica]
MRISVYSTRVRVGCEGASLHFKFQRYKPVTDVRTDNGARGQHRLFGTIWVRTRDFSRAAPYPTHPPAQGRGVKEYLALIKIQQDGSGTTLPRPAQPA